jgi:class 3 adenylate cyclase
MDRVRREASVRAVVHAHNGAVVRTLGDGVMARFDSAMAAFAGGLVGATGGRWRKRRPSCTFAW